MDGEVTPSSGGHSGGVIAEFKHAPKGAKIAMVLALVAAAGIGYYEYSKSKSTSSGIGPASPSTDLSGVAGASNGAAASGIQSVPNSNGGQTPVLPAGLSPIFDGLGQLIGWGPSTPTNTGSSPSGTPNPSPTPTPKPGPGPQPNPQPGPKSGGPSPAWNPFTPLFGATPNGFRDVTGNVVTINGKVWTVVTGSNGRIWGAPGRVSAQTATNMPIAQGQKELLYQSPHGGGMLHKGNMGGSNVTRGINMGPNEGGGDMERNEIPRQGQRMQRYVVSTHGHMHAVTYEAKQ